MPNEESLKKEFLGINTYNRPQLCDECSGIMVFKGVGEYRCEDCGAIAYDDYGKTRNYIESHPGATASQVSEETGVSQKSIRQMLKESRLEVSAESRMFLKCEMCGVDIRSGTLCSKCEATYHRKLEDQERTKKNITGFGSNKDHSESGEKRFNRNDR